MIDFLRRICGYSMPRLGPLAFRTYFRLAPTEAVKELFPGIRVKMNFNDESCRAAWWNGFRYERPLPTLLRNLCSDGVDAFFDIGANIGFFSFLISSYCRSVKVFSFEPNPENFAILIDARHRNSLENLFPMNLGLGDAEGELALTVDPTSSGHATFGAEHPDFDPSAKGIRTFQIPVRRFDDWLATQPTIGRRRAVAKIDIEGFEARALRGMSDALQRQLFKALIIEVYTSTLRLCGSSPAELESLLAGFGYRPFDLTGRATSIQPDEARNLVFLPEGD